MSNQSTPTLSRPAPGKHHGSDTLDGIEPLFAELAHLRRDDPRRIALREDLITRCLPLAEHIAGKFAARPLPFDDLLTAARTGMVAAVDRYDPDFDAPFLRYAIPAITDAVHRLFHEVIWIPRIPLRLNGIQQSIEPAIPVLQQRLGRMPTATQIARELGADPADVTLALVARNAYRTH
ncbi:sigma factor [Nocardia sp. XZ_19_385]|uniref:sigma factor n=1 Tax=Nocardia sp. XZ_19_385 TaxID=2769488 RepID=UPI00188DD636|nr:sigma factor [Nocardia sp. XZ_19_385]